MKIFCHDKGVFGQSIISPFGGPDGEMTQFRQNDSGTAGAFSRRKEKAAGPTVYFWYTGGPHRIMPNCLPGRVLVKIGFSMRNRDLPRHAADW